MLSEYAAEYGGPPDPRMAWPVFLGMADYSPRFAARRRLAALESGAVAFGGGGQGFELIARAIEEQALPGQHRRRRTS